jgi:hypothetical protein
MIQLSFKVLYFAHEPLLAAFPLLFELLQLMRNVSVPIL